MSCFRFTKASSSSHFQTWLLKSFSSSGLEKLMDDHEDKAAVGKVWKYVLVDDPKDKASVGEVHGASS